MRYIHLKQFFDFLLAALLLIVLSWLLLLFFLILLIMGTNPLFIQIRTGYSGRTFRILKFRTMKERAGGKPHLIGHFLRRTSLDELPQLWNILRGEMSFVGPRPLLPEYLPLYSPEQQKRHQVKPGITGWAQVKGRNALSWQQQFALDVWYVRHQSFMLDLKILALTFLRLLTPSSREVQLRKPFTGEN